MEEGGRGEYINSKSSKNNIKKGGTCTKAKASFSSVRFTWLKTDCWSLQERKKEKKKRGN